jgi:hypothetical protein
MAQIIIWALRQNLAGRNKAISDVLHACVTAALDLTADKRFSRFIALEEDCVNPPDRSRRYPWASPRKLSRLPSTIVPKKTREFAESPVRSWPCRTRWKNEKGIYKMCGFGVHTVVGNA